MVARVSRSSVDGRHHPPFQSALNDREQGTRPPPPRDIGVGRPARGSIEINRRGDIDLNRYDATSKYAPSRRQTAAMNSPLLPTRALFSDAATLENEFKNTREMVPSKVLAIAIVKIRNVGYGRGVKRKAEIF